MIVIHILWFMQLPARKRIVGKHMQEKQKNANILFSRTLWLGQDEATGEHFTLPGHSLSDLSITVVEQNKRNNNLLEKKENNTILIV